MTLHLSVVLFIAVAFGLCLFEADAKPAMQKWPPDVSHRPPTVDECNRETKTLDLCQHCAKRTKSSHVYPMCCENREGARLWCKRYLNYGIRDRGAS